MKRLWKDAWAFYDAVYSCAFKRDCNEMRYDDQSYALNTKQKTKMKGILIGYWIITAIAVFVEMQLGAIVIETSLMMTVLLVFGIHALVVTMYLALARRYVGKCLAV